MGTGVCAMGAYDGQALTARISLLSFLQDNESVCVRFQRRVAYCYIRIAWHRVLSRVRDLDCKTSPSHI